MRSPALGTTTLTMPAASANPCSRLGDYLRTAWENRGELALTLDCAPRGEDLVVLVEHPLTVQPHVVNTFAAIQQILETAPLELWQDWLGSVLPVASLTVHYFMRVLQQPQYYADQRETLALPAVAPESLNPSTPLKLSTTSSALAKIEPSLEVDEEEEVLLDPEIAAAFMPEVVWQPGPPPPHPLDAELALEDADFAFGPSQELEAAYLEEDEEDPEDLPERDPLVIPRSVWVAGLGLCLLAFVGSFYITSRPCWLRNCTPLTLAVQTGQEANSKIQVASTWQDLEQAKGELDLALKHLREVPGWSSYGEQAQGLRTGYRKLLQSLTPVQDALKQAETAQQKSQGNPLAEKQWREVLAHWEAAIAQLKGVSPQSPLYALAQDKLAQYEAQRITVQTRLENEASGQQLLDEARKFASAAPTLKDDLSQLEFLRQTQSALQDAMFTLRKIPKGTTAYQEAVRLLSRYEAELSMNAGQQSKEEFIVNRYQEALSRAESAKVAESQDRWADATEAWQQALASLQQIPSASAYFAQAQELISKYDYALSQAEQKANQAAALDDVKRKVDSICAGTPQVCTYDISPQLISVQLTLEYERAVLTAGTLGDDQSRLGALNHVKALENSLEQASNAAQIPLELYDPDGVLVGVHQPRSDGSI